MEWFETWFDSEYYHKLYQNRNDQEAEFFLNNLLQHLNFSNNSRILDLACGKGRHAIYLNKKGFNVTGTDLSENSISTAKEFESTALEFRVNDMRLPLSTEPFNAILNLFTSFGYFNSTDENLKVLESINQMLTSSGVFVIDFMNAKKVIDHLVKEEIKTIDDITFRLSRSVEDGLIIKRIQFEDQGKSFSFEEKVQALYLDDFEQLISKSNLKIDSIFGNYHLHPFDEKESDRLILIGSKK